jgi:hypothetical protein
LYLGKQYGDGKARIFLGIVIDGEVGRGMLALFGLSCVRWAGAWL